MKKQDKISRSKKTSKLETRVYEYGVVQILNKEQEEYIEDQIFRANLFRNKLVTIERSRRARIRKIMKIICPDLETMEQQYEALDRQIKKIHIEKLSGVEKANRDPVVLKEIENIKDQKKALADNIKKKREDVITQTFRSADEKWKLEYRKEVLAVLVSQGKLPKAVLGNKPINNMSKEDYEKYLDDAVAPKSSNNFPKALLGPNAGDRQKAKKKATERLHEEWRERMASI